MKAIVQSGPESIDVVEQERPSIAADEVLIQVHSTGVCGSDAHAFHYEGGYEWVQLPRIMGHEYSGEIVEVGDDVDSLSLGDRVVEEPTQTCGTCFQCKSGQSNVCQNFSVKGMHRNGSYAEYTVGNPEKIHLVPDAVPLEHAAIAEPLSVAARTVLSQSNLKPGQTALVEGPGPIGTLVASIADSIGAKVLVSGLGQDEKYRLPLVEDLGIETVNLSESDLSEVTESFTDGIGFDVVFDSTGHRSGIELGVEQVRKGGEVIVVGLPGDASEIALSPVVRSEVSINTSYGSSWENFEQALNLLEEGVVDAEDIIDTSFEVTNPGEAFSAFFRSETSKPVFSFTELSDT
ncbi:alcohol dehydrogenase [Haloferax sp. Atlit-19N]|uniref:zinc-dependent alcohol dehydrogenase n=1 Tax=Haloferax sp. Atlit-19N TaxID=2077201 RepID=UPI000E246CEC|nr:alcohol dehydrogenase catalytic domain-containing protein [Haloferax sp. Atlit-19N]RDZ39503.1 alcohol dehydrogenase [Haloferax sp. Atlit-19N]